MFNSRSSARLVTVFLGSTILVSLTEAAAAPPPSGLLDASKWFAKAAGAAGSVNNTYDYGTRDTSDDGCPLGWAECSVDTCYPLDGSTCCLGKPFFIPITAATAARLLTRPLQTGTSASLGSTATTADAARTTTSATAVPLPRRRSLHLVPRRLRARCRRTARSPRPSAAPLRPRSTAEPSPLSPLPHRRACPSLRPPSQLTMVR